MHLDLHLHTTCSDGALAPEALVLAARRAGLDAIAVTDHDTMAGVVPARVAAGEGGPVVRLVIDLRNASSEARAFIQKIVKNEGGGSVDLAFGTVKK